MSYIIAKLLLVLNDIIDMFAVYEDMCIKKDTLQT